MTHELSTASCSSLNQYLNHVRTIPILSQEQEQELVKDLTQQNRKLLAYHHLHLVVGLAMKFTTSSHTDTGELIQAGNLGLMKGIQAFKPDFGVRVSTYVAYHVRNEICEWILCNWSPVKIATTKEQRKIFFNMSKLNKATTEQQMKELADCLNVDVAEIHEMKKRISGRHGNVSFESSLDDNDDEYSKLDRTLLDHSEVDLVGTSAVEVINEEQQRKMIMKALNKLNDRQKEIITARYLTDKAIPFNQLAERFGVSQQRVCQIERDAIKIMKENLAIDCYDLG